MAVVGTTTVTKKNGIMTGTWAVTSGIAAGNASDLIDFSGCEIVHYYLSTTTGYSSGTYEIAMAMETDTDGMFPEDAGQHLRAERTSSSVNLAGYIRTPPHRAAFALRTAGAGVTAYTVSFVAVPLSVASVKHGRA